ncbi:MAG: energy-coupling factor transporter transmembrane component T family protein [Kineosporiaceae bacterium]
MTGRAGRWTPPAANPLTKFAAATLLALSFVIAVDPVSAAVAVALQAAALPWLGVGGRALGYRLALVAAVAVPIGGFTAWAGPDSGRALLDLGGPVTVTEGSALLGLAVGLRVVAVALPGVLLLATTDPTDLADALEQHTPLPPRVVLGALAGLRLVSVVAEDVAALRLARRARGAAPVWASPRQAGSAAVVVLALALGRARTLSLAMEARGFGAGPRTWSRRSRFGPADAVLLAGTVVLVGVATVAGVAAGTWRVVWA